MPQDTWPVTKDDKVQIQELGRKLNEFFKKEFANKDSVHLKIVVGSFNYIMDLQAQRGKLISDDFILAEKAVVSAGLDVKIEEPFTVAPDLAEPTLAERRAHLAEELARIDAEIEISEASPAPSDSAPVDPSVMVEGPQVEVTEAAPVAETTPAPEVAPVEQQA